MSQTRQDLRQHIRQRRNQLPSEIQFQASQDLIHNAAQQVEFKHSQHIALYLSTDGELDTMPLIEWLWTQGKSIYLPVLHPFSKGHLLFLHYQFDTPMTYNQYGIIEPKLNKQLVKPVKELDLICTPLVAFDAQGHRLGMGGGYYDRTLSTWFTTGQGAKPIGLAHDCQYVETLPTESWDIPLPKIVTPTRSWQWKA
ncbi:5-formyltetrahydrofolate cyclo-ligase [Vibrio cincinnatiensis]|jgi:5-formyltetrahydrofolate cyclo-ligase|uniref:5-formyltetrahydrofolate cyclo-ligase n=1 Tax=Vibrio cincinnatiensis DSM 19608 TaxID=1123491 RepID=A0A1T4P8N3_VIBCI|nr:5-formyltetrahydrofolate cyclo-ligase [Vibrio cincinnatiensis]MCG3724468.1 5-formyltetrahydrofolate cyclo-ligase [Vibrio cincinnatiensis]MCG3731399.1 5-formyltetrahydrofolate cyclo-ligase [Vibrio cincinnatiensis]MCG3735219.1 5-formyltetrahydrofolate cyclo-ligase [Vibrio cincinnatiensis]MCG3739094.1 5-formyltetrahydrofolate cyclo-ligase [Vibrio cincinnatiensis]MCG3742478.1 5-formyltetrahydrofolate cyclo-ligase [Vibrio cincinnatiensis]